MKQICKYRPVWPHVDPLLWFSLCQCRATPVSLRIEGDFEKQLSYSSHRNYKTNLLTYQCRPFRQQTSRPRPQSERCPGSLPGRGWWEEQWRGCWAMPTSPCRGWSPARPPLPSTSPLPTSSLCWTARRWRGQRTSGGRQGPWWWLSGGRDDLCAGTRPRLSLSWGLSSVSTSRHLYLTANTDNSPLKVRSPSSRSSTWTPGSSRLPTLPLRSTLLWSRQNILRSQTEKTWTPRLF